MHREHAAIEERISNPYFEADMVMRQEASRTIKELRQRLETVQHRCDQLEREKQADGIVSRFLQGRAS